MAKHEYLETLFKIKNVEEKMGADKRTIPNINIKIANGLKKTNPNDEYVPQYVAKTRNKLKKLRNCQVEGMTGLEYLEKNRESILGMKELDVDAFINKYYISEKQKVELEKQRLEAEKKRKEAEEEARKKFEAEQKIKLEAEQKKQEAEQKRLKALEKQQEEEDAYIEKFFEDNPKEKIGRDKLRQMYREKVKITE